MSIPQMEESTAALPAVPGTSLAERLNSSLIAGIIVGFLLRCAGGASGVLLGFYLNRVVSARSGAIDPSVIAILTAAFFTVELLLAPVFGSWSDRIGRKPFLLAGPIIAGIAVQIHPLTTLIWVITFGRILEGLSTSATTPGTLGFLSDMTSGHASLRGRVMGLYELGSLLGIVLGPAVGGQLWDLFHRNGLRMVSLLDLAAALLVIFFIRESRPVTAATGLAAVAGKAWRTQVSAFGALLRLPRLWQFAPAWIAVNAVVGLWFSHIAPLLSRTHRQPPQLLVGGWTGEQVGLVFLGFGLAFAGGIWFWSRLYGRMRRTDMMLWSLGGAVVTCLALFGINMEVLPGPLGQWPLVPILFAGLFVESGFTPVALAYLADITEGQVENRGTVMGLYSVFLALGQVLGTAIGAPFVSAFNFNGVLLATGLLVLVAGAAVIHLRQTTGD